MEGSLNTMMFDIPDDKTISKITITKEFIEDNKLENLIIERSDNISNKKGMSPQKAVEAGQNI